MKFLLYCLLPLLSLNSFLFPDYRVWAQSVEYIDLKTVQSRQEAIPVSVHEGYGMNVSFLNTDEYIVFAVLDNPALYSLILDGSSCEQKTCVSQMIHLRLTQGIHLPHLTTNHSQHTFLNVKTRNRHNQTQLYVFRLMPKKGEPQYHTLVFDAAQETVTTAGNALELSYVTQGLIFAQAQQKLPEQPDLWQKIQDFILYVKQGIPYLEASQKAGVPISLLYQLETWGKEFSAQSEVSR